MLRFLLSIACVGCFLVSSGQGKKLKYEAELGQLNDLDGGVLLVPVETGSTGIAASNAIMAAQREDRRAFEQAWVNGFSMATVYFFSQADTAQFTGELLELNVWDAAGNTPAQWPRKLDDVFVLDIKGEGEVIRPDVIITNSIVQRREARAVMFSEQKQARRQKRADRLRKRMRHGAAIWHHPKLVRNVNRLNQLENGRDTSAFQLTYSNFDPVNTDAAGWVIHRYTPKVVVRHADLKYDFDYHYFVKVHYQTPPEIRYPDAVSFLERRIRERMMYLREKY